jgi:hypothetical protein
VSMGHCKGCQGASLGVSTIENVQVPRGLVLGGKWALDPKMPKVGKGDGSYPPPPPLPACPNQWLSMATSHTPPLPLPPPIPRGFGGFGESAVVRLPAGTQGADLQQAPPTSGKGRPIPHPSPVGSTPKGAFLSSLSTVNACNLAPDFSQPAPPRVVVLGCTGGQIELGKKQWIALDEAVTDVRSAAGNSRRRRRN